MTSYITFIAYFALLATTSSVSATCALSNSTCTTALASSHLDELLTILGVSDNQLSLGTVAATVDDFSFNFTDVIVTRQDPINVINVTFDTTFNVLSIEAETSLTLSFTKFTTSGSVFGLTLNSTGSGEIIGQNIHFYFFSPFTMTTNSDGDDIIVLSSYEYHFIVENVTYALDFDDSSLDDVNTFLNLDPVAQVLTKEHGLYYYGKIMDIVGNALNETAADTILSDYFTY